MRDSEPHFDFSMIAMHSFSERTSISLRRIAGFTTALNNQQEAAYLLHRFVRNAEEVGGEQGQKTINSLLLTEDIAESCNLPLLAVEFRCTRRLYDGEKVNLLEFAENLLSQGELIRAEEVSYEIANTNWAKTQLLSLLSVKSTLKNATYFVDLVSQTAIALLYHLITPFCLSQSNCFLHQATSPGAH